MKTAPVFRFFFTPLEWFFLVFLVLSTGGYFAYPSVKDYVSKNISADLLEELKTTTDKFTNLQKEVKTLKEQLDVSKQELETAKNQLTETQNELNETKEKFETVQKKTKELGSIIKKIPTESTSEEDQEKLRKWRVYGRNASAYQDYLEGKTGASKVPRPSFPEVFF